MNKFQTRVTIMMTFLFYLNAFAWGYFIAATHPITEWQTWLMIMFPAIYLALGSKL